MLIPVENYPAILHEHGRHRTLVIADLHLGWEVSLVRKGIHVPSQMPKIRRKLIQLIEGTAPQTLIILGDVKHTIAKAEPGEWHDIPEFFEAVEPEVSEICIVRGNHDGNLEPLLPPTVKLHPSSGTILNGVGLFHGHTWPARKLLECNTLIMGHVHPTIAFRDSIGFRIVTPVWVKAKCNVNKLVEAYLRSKRLKIGESPRATIKKRFGVNPKVKQLFIIPCFNDFLGGRPINKKSDRGRYIGPILRSKSVDIDEAEAYLFDWTFLGTVKQLKTLSHGSRVNSY